MEVRVDSVCSFLIKLLCCCYCLLLFLLLTFFVLVMVVDVIMMICDAFWWIMDRNELQTMNGDCAWSCSVDTDESAFAAVTSQMRSAAAASHSNFLGNSSIPLQGCSEFSLATYHDSNNACRGLNMLQMMYSAQADGFEVSYW